MTNIINLHTHRKARRHERAKGITLCQSGFHQWQAVTDTRFEVKHGKLITAEYCTRCQAERTRFLHRRAQGRYEDCTRYR